MPKTQLSCDRLLALLYDKETREVDISSHPSFVQKRNGGRNCSTLSIQDPMKGVLHSLFANVKTWQERLPVHYEFAELKAQHWCCDLLLSFVLVYILYSCHVFFCAPLSQVSNGCPDISTQEKDMLFRAKFLSQFIGLIGLPWLRRCLHCVMSSRHLMSGTGCWSIAGGLEAWVRDTEGNASNKTFFPIKEDTRYTKIDSKLDITKRTCAACEFSNYVFSKRSRHKFRKGASWIASYVPLKWFLLRRLGQNSEGEACCWNWWTLNCSTNWINRICSKWTIAQCTSSDYEGSRFGS